MIISEDSMIEESNIFEGNMIEGVYHNHNFISLDIMTKVNCRDIFN